MGEEACRDQRIAADLRGIDTSGVTGGAFCFMCGLVDPDEHKE